MACPGLPHLHMHVDISRHPSAPPDPFSLEQGGKLLATDSENADGKRLELQLPSHLSANYFI